MSARPAILYTALFFVLLPIYLWSRPVLRAPSELEQRQESLLKLGDIQAISMTRGTESLRFQKTADGKLYQVVAPQGKFIPQDLMNRMAESLAHAKSVEVVAENAADLRQFGLEHPASEITIESAGQAQPIKIAFGNENPTLTAVYGKLEGNPKVFLLGKDVEYYQQLMFEWVEGKQGNKS